MMPDSTIPSTDMTQFKASFRDHGFIVLKDFFDKDEMSELRRCVDGVYPNWLAENGEHIFKHRLVNMHSLTHADYYAQNPELRVNFFRAIANPKLLVVLDDVFGEGHYFHNTQLFFNPSNPERTPYWHRDLQYSPIPDSEQQQVQTQMVSLHVRIPLLPENSLEVVPGSHRQWDTELERMVRFEQHGHRSHEALPGRRRIALDVGDVLIFDAQMLHRGTYDIDRERMALDLCLGHPHPLTQTFLDPAVLPTAAELETLAQPELFLLAHKLLDGK